MRGFVPALACVLAIPALALAYPPASVTDVTQNSVKIGGLDCGTRYEFRIRERNSTNTAWTNTTTQTRTTAACTPPASPPPPAPPPPPPTCDPALEPGPIARQGYTSRFTDCFDTLDRSVWCPRQWWEPNPPTGSQFVTNGELHLIKRRADGYRNTTMTTEPCGQANPKSFRQGYFEARMKFDTVRGNGPAFWMLSTRHATNPAFPNINPVCAQQGLPRAECLTSELDVIEGFGNIQYGGSRQDDFFSGALHRNTSGFYGAPDSVRAVQRGTGLEMEDYHVYAAKWTASQVSWYIDGQLQGTVDAFDSTNQPMHLILHNWNTSWEDENMPNASTPDTLDVAVDWVRVWQQ
jgi:Glycosyl hydrolases family 16